MNNLQRKDIIKKATNQLKVGIFPNEHLEEIRSKKERKEISDQVLYAQGSVHFDRLSDKEKSTRQKRLKVELAFVGYMSSISTAQRAGVILMITGFIVTAATINVPGNLPLGLITLIQGTIVLGVSLKNKWVINFHSIIIWGFALAFLIELMVNQFPDKLIYDPQVFHPRHPGSRPGMRSGGGILILLNSVSPYAYIFTKFSVGLMLILIWIEIKKFNKVKDKFEKGDS